MMSGKEALCIRRARAGDVAAMQAIELDAARAYGGLGATRFCVDLPARDEADHRSAREDGLALVGEVEGQPRAFLLAVPLDGRAHVLELAVSLAFQGRGYGTAMMAAFETWAHQGGFAEATLTTFRDVSWNAPYYRRLGYENIEVGLDRHDLSAVIAEETGAGFHQAPRVAMAKLLR